MFTIKYSVISRFPNESITIHSSDKGWEAHFHLKIKVLIFYIGLLDVAILFLKKLEIVSRKLKGQAL